MQIFNFANQEYYLGTEIIKNNQNIFTNKINTKIRQRKMVIDKLQPPTNKHMYMYYNEKTKCWKVSTVSYSKAKLFIEKTFFDNFVLANNSNKLKPLPPIIHLQDNEKFYDDNGVINIEARGARTKSKIFFKMEHIAVGFEITYLKKTLIANNTNYLINEDYVFFEKENKQKCMFITYKGILKIIFNSRNKKTKKFRSWMENVLFTCQMGNSEEKTSLASDLLGIEIKSFISTLKATSAASLPAIYLIKIGFIGDLEEIECERNNVHVFKYGFTDNLERRANEHSRKYGKLKGSNVCMYKFIYIDSAYLSQAETALKQKFSVAKAIKIKFQQEQEIIGITLNKEGKQSIMDSFDILFKKFGGKLKDMKHQNDLLLQKQETTIRHEYELKMQKMEAESSKRIMELEMEKKFEQKLLAQQLENQKKEMKMQKEFYEMQIKLLKKQNKRKRKHNNNDKDDSGDDSEDSYISSEPSSKKRRLW